MALASMLPSAPALAEFSYLAPAAPRPALVVLRPEPSTVLEATIERLAPAGVKIRWDRRVDVHRPVPETPADWRSLLFALGLAWERRRGEIHVRPAGVPAGEVELIAGRDGEGDWKARSGQTLRETLERWGRRAGVEIVFLTDRRYLLRRTAVLRGTFEAAVRTLLFRLSHLPHPPAGELAGDGRSLAVTHRRRPPDPGEDR